MILDFLQFVVFGLLTLLGAYLHNNFGRNERATLLIICIITALAAMESFVGLRRTFHDMVTGG